MKPIITLLLVSVLFSACGSPDEITSPTTSIIDSLPAKHSGLESLHLDSIPEKTEIVSFIDTIANAKRSIYQLKGTEALQVIMFSQSEYLTTRLTADKSNGGDRFTFTFSGGDDKGMKIVFDRTFDEITYFTPEGVEHAKYKALK